MRSLKELYEIVLNNIEKEKGICHCILFLHLKEVITSDEEEELTKHFKSVKRPKYKFKYFFHNPNKVNRYRPNNYYWEEYYVEPRIKFIKEIIKTLE